jgi:4-amino-4-deoxy-L-arabinose transferase-like glycosyltransferase
LIGRVLSADVPSFFEKHASLFYSVSLLLAAFHLFFRLGSGAVFEWDEARHGINAFEMFQSGHYSFTTFDHSPELYNLKPPLGTWLIVLSYKLFGVGVFSLRFFSAFLSLACVAVLLIKTQQVLGKSYAALSALILATTPPLIFLHCGRTGDYSAILTFFSFLALVFMIQAVEKPAFLCAACLSFSAAFLLYSFASFQILAWMGAFCLVTGLWKRLTFRQYLLAFVCAVLPIAIWMTIRYFQVSGPEFLKQMVYYDLLTRSSHPIEGHLTNPFHYINVMFSADPAWTVMALVVLPLYFYWNRFSFPPSLVLGAGLAVLIPFGLFSMARTRIDWYIDPIFPPLAIALGWMILTLLKHPRCTPKIRALIIVLLFCSVLSSEGKILWKLRNVPSATSQSILAELKAKGIPPHSSMMLQSSRQNDRFAAEALCRMDVFLSDKRENCEGINYWMLQNNADNLNYIQLKQYQVVLRNIDWVVAIPVALPSHP